MTDKKKKDTLVNFKCEEELATAFKRICNQQGYTQSFVLREPMKKYLKDNKQADLFKGTSKNPHKSTKLA